MSVCCSKLGVSDHVSRPAHASTRTKVPQDSHLLLRIGFLKTLRCGYIQSGDLWLKPSKTAIFQYGSIVCL